MRKRYRRQARRSGAHSPLAVAGICVVIAILLTVIVGNLLTLWLDDETYARLTSGKAEDPAAQVLHKTAVPNVNAYPHVLGNDPVASSDFPAISVSLNNPDGTLNYVSDVSDYQGLAGNAKAPLSETMQELSLHTVYISGVFYPQVFSYDTEDLRFSATAAEGALLREFMRSGAKDVILASIPFESLSLTDVLTYVKAIKSTLGERPLGVAVPLSAAQGENGWELLSALLNVCDFCALDVTEVLPHADGTLPTASEILSNADYFLAQYDMRLMLTDKQTELRAEVEMRMISDYQIIQSSPAPSLP